MSEKNISRRDLLYWHGKYCYEIGASEAKGATKEHVKMLKEKKSKYVCEILKRMGIGEREK